jgi:intracellular septation protein
MIRAARDAPFTTESAVQILIELAPLIAFFVTYKWFGGIYPATAVLMVGMLLLLAWDWLRTRKLPQMHLVSAVLVWVFGAATLLLRDDRFIQWKATVFYWLVALVLAGSVWIGKMTLLERLLSKSLPEDVSVQSASWRNLSLVSALFYFALGALNLWIAYNMSREAWVNFKTFVVIPLVFVFTAGVLFWIMRQQPATTSPPDKST